MDTWESVQIASLQKMFLIKGNTLVKDSSTNPYLASMPQVANEALQLLSTAGKFITKSIDVVQDSLEGVNLLSTGLYMMNVYQHKNADISYSATGAKSYYFEVDNPGTIEISIGGVVTTITNTVKNKFTAYKGNLSNPTGSLVTIAFKGSYPYQYRNVAFYDVTFETDADVWDYVSEKRYELKTLATDYYKFKEIIYQGGFNDTRYEKTSDFHMEGDSTLVLNGFNKGSWKVTYFAYPQQITKDTLDATVLSLDPEVSILLPLYIASELYMDDDAGLSTSWRNKFEIARAELRPNEDKGTVEFISESRW